MGKLSTYRVFVLNNYWSDNNNTDLKDVDFNELYFWNSPVSGYISTSPYLFMRSLESYGKFSDNVDDIGIDLSDWTGKTVIFIFTCRDCGKLVYSTLNTIQRRNAFLCKDCSFSSRKLKRNGTMSSEHPEFSEYFVSVNGLKYSDFEAVNSSREKISFRCEICDEVFETRVCDIIEKGRSLCKRCTRMLTSAFNNGSLRDRYPSVADMFDGGGNSISSCEVSSGTNMLARFRCDGGGKEHFFNRQVSAVCAAVRNGGIGCPVCAGFEAYRGINDFESAAPNVAKLWDYTKNECNPWEVTAHSDIEYWFKCTKGHEFKRTPHNIVRHLSENAFDGCTVCSGKTVQDGVNSLIDMRPDVANYWDYENNLMDPHDIGQFSNQEAYFFCKSCGNRFLYRIDNWSMTNGLCEECRKTKGYSKGEKELVGYVKSLGLEVEENKRFGDFELDLYIPSLRIGIEYNGLYWHSTAVRKDKDYHYRKYINAKEKGISILTVWEDDWECRRSVVEDMISTKLGKFSGLSYNARECEINNNVSIDNAKTFLNKHHIQGFCSGSLYIGLEYKGTLVAIAVFKETGIGALRLERYCTSGLVRGGFSKILRLIKELGYLSIKTFSDRLISDGSLYKKNGFQFDGELRPDYCYLVGNKRVHKFNYRIDRFRKDPNLIYRDGLSETELAELNNLPRIYDAGKIRWVISF